MLNEFSSREVKTLGRLKQQYRRSKMGLIKSLFWLGVGVMALYGMYSCNKNMAERRHQRLEKSALEAKIENDFHSNQIRIVGDEVIYTPRLQEGYAQYCLQK